MLTSYSDISINDISSVCEHVRQSTFKHNLDNTRVIIKWYGDTPSCVMLLGCVIRTYAEAKAFYSDPVNNWVPSFTGQY
jgi:hypothetical protein